MDGVFVWVQRTRPEGEPTGWMVVGGGLGTIYAFADVFLHVPSWLSCHVGDGACAAFRMCYAYVIDRCLQMNMCEARPIIHYGLHR